MTSETAIKVTVKLFAHFRTGRFRESVQNYPAGFCVCDSLSELQITNVSSGIVLVNGKPAPLDQCLQDGDTLSIFPLVSGG